MADNITIKDAAGTNVVLGAKDLSSVFLPKHLLVDDAGDATLVSAASGALAENAAGWAQVAGMNYALDPAASAGSRAVPLQVESTAQPNLRVTVQNAGNRLPAGDAVGRRIYVQHTDGTNSTPSMDAVSRPGYQALTGVASNGLTRGRRRNLNATVQAAKASAGVLYSLDVLNNSGAAAFVQVHDLAAGSVILGTSASDLQVLVPNGGTISLNWPLGIPFTSAISISSTTADDGSVGSSNGVYATWTLK